MRVQNEPKDGWKGDKNHTERDINGFIISDGEVEEQQTFRWNWNCSNGFDTQGQCYGISVASVYWNRGLERPKLIVINLGKLYNLIRRIELVWSNCFSSVWQLLPQAQTLSYCQGSVRPYFRVNWSYPVFPKPKSSHYQTLSIAINQSFI